jgi:flagellar biosynthesis protein FliR
MPELGAEGLALLLTGARVSPVCVLGAAVSRTLVPWPVALSLALALSLGLTAPLAPEVQVALLPLLLVRELCLGFAFALAVLLPVLSLGWGVRLAEQLLPTPPLASSPLSALYTWLSALMFFSLSGHRALTMGLSATLLDLPPGTAGFDRAAFAFGVTGFVVDAFGFALALAVPLLASVWIAGAVIALMARALRLPPSLDGSVRAPLLVLAAAVLAAPLLARVPDAMRTGLAAARAVVLQIAR